jgi:integrase
MKSRQAGTKAATAAKWQRTQYSNLIRYVPSGKYFARLRVAGKLIIKSLKTNRLPFAKLRLNDLEKNEREAAESGASASNGRMTFGECVKIFREQTEASNLLKPSTKHYRHETLISILKSWRGIESRDVRQISAADCNTWAAKFSKQYSATRYNGAIGVLRAIFETAIQAGALYRNPAAVIKRARVRLPHLALPDTEQFERFVNEIQSANGRDSKKCADMVRFLAYGGFRVSEARNITWGDCDFFKGEITVRGDVDTGTKNWSVRRVPMIPEMRQLLEQWRANRMNEPLTNPVMRVKECLLAMRRAAKVVGMAQITHHHLRHLFATRCIESGVDIPTVSRWLGHRDGGALAMRVYGHLREQHSVAMAQKVFFSKNHASNIIQLNKDSLA